MTVTALIENISKSELKAKHGLSLYIKTANHEILFDLGSDGTLFENAQKRGVDLSAIDTVIISHGHIDHGGALNDFLNVNSSAKIYVQRKAFEPHYSKIAFLKISIGLDNKLKTHPQIVLVDGDYKIDDELTLLTVKKSEQCHSPVNDVLYDKSGKDSFSHEQNLIIAENQTTLIMGCGHLGVVNVMEEAKEYKPNVCIGGYHLFNPITKKTASPALLDAIVKALEAYSQIQFYTCHCTGQKAFQYLSKQMPNLNYLSCGESIKIN